ncbi:hypothetical protein GLP24_14525 [Photobacterium carnosum]|nr:hypothetical protein [Photobacterium carnosum]
MTTWDYFSWWFNYGKVVFDVLSNKDDVKVGLITYKQCTYAADLVKGHQGSQVRTKRSVWVSLGRSI